MVPLPSNTGTFRFKRSRFSQLVLRFMSHCHSAVYSPLKVCAEQRLGRRQLSIMSICFISCFSVCDLSPTPNAVDADCVRRRCRLRSLPMRMANGADADARLLTRKILRSKVLCVPCVLWDCCSSTDISLTKRCAFKRISLAEWQHLVVELGVRAHALHLIHGTLGDKRLENN